MIKILQPMADVACKFGRVHAPDAAAFCQLRQIGFTEGFKIMVMIQVPTEREKSLGKHGKNHKSARMLQGVAPNRPFTRSVAQ